MHTRFSALLLAALLAFNLHAAGPDYTKLVQASFDNVDWNFKQDFAFTETQMSGDTRTVARFDPSAPDDEQWTLLSFDNRPPSVEETEAFLEEKSWNRGHGRGDGDDDVLKLIDMDSLELIEATSDYWLLSFKPDFDDEDKDDRKFFKNMVGELRISRQSGAIETMDIRNTKPIRPIVGAKIKSVTMRFEFGEATDKGPLVLTHVSAGARGSAMLVVRFNELETYEFSDFVYVGD